MVASRTGQRCLFFGKIFEKFLVPNDGCLAFLGSTVFPRLAHLGEARPVGFGLSLVATVQCAQRSCGSDGTSGADGR